MTRRFVFLLSIFCFGFASAQTPLRTKVFPGAQALPLIAGVQQGIFERHGIKLDLLFTASSQELRDGLASGEFQIALAGFSASEMDSLKKILGRMHANLEAYVGETDAA